MLENIVVNWQVVDQEVRSFVRVGVRYGSGVQKIKRLLDESLTTNEGILKGPSPIVFFEDFGDSALIFDSFF